MTSGELAWQGFASHLAVEPAGRESEGWCVPAIGTRPYGGHLVAQSLMLALRRASPGLVPLTVHTYFLAVGDTRRPVRYRTERLRSGRSFEHWCVDAVQGDLRLSRVTVVLHRLEEGPRYAVRPRRASSPDASPVVTFEPPSGSRAAVREGLEIRRAAQWQVGDSELPYQDAWIRCVEQLPAGMAEVVLAWCSDLELAPTVDLPYRDGIVGRTGASLEHSIRFHAPFDATQWMLLEQTGEALAYSRGLATGRVFSTQGELLATIVQHTLLRLTLGGTS